MNTNTISPIGGSSPLTRGTLNRSAILLRQRRFIPAYAGNSFRSLAGFCCASGSSPLTRGTQEVKRLRAERLRFIPAYAGNSPNVKYLSHNNTVHPRLRGELKVGNFTKSKNRGSSPLTRGTRLNQLFNIFSQRFIPAYAGNS